MPSKSGRKFVATVADMSDENLHCHVYGHPWQEGPVTEETPEEFGVRAWVSRQECTSCTKVRTDYMEPDTFELLLRTYSEVDGYRTIEATTFIDYRGESARRRFSRKRVRSGRS